jgi:DNA mismatch repair protein MutS
VKRGADVSPAIEAWCADLDLSWTMAGLANEWLWKRPVFVDAAEGFFEATKLRHPSLERIQLGGNPYISHTVGLSSEEAEEATDKIAWTKRGLLLYGMNASGKSSLMKAIGISILLAQVGSYVPASSMTLRPYKRLATRILNQDNLWAGLSSFAVEMSEVREILSVADHQTLVLGDELCSGTESISGTAIVAAGIQHMEKAGTQFVLATHLHDLMKLKQITELQGLKVYHLHVEYDPVKDILVYHRTLREGSGSTMYGLEVAKALHLPIDMIESAFSFRRELLGETAVEDAPQSAWSSSLVRRSCSVCGSAVTKSLEVHHLEQRKDAVNQRNKDGQALNHLRNLATLCQTCHDKHHAGVLHVGPVEDTSEGPMRSILDLSEYAHVPKSSPQKKVLFTKEQLHSIKATQQAHRDLHPKLLLFQIKKEHDISITELQYKNLKIKGLV